MPITPATISFDLSGLPAQLQTFVTDLDAALASGWTIGQRVRQLSFQWATYGGYSAPKLAALSNLLEMYRSRGWVQAMIAKAPALSNQTQVTLIFEY